MKITVAEAKLAGLDAFIDSLLNLEDMDTLLGRGTSQDILSWVENNAGDLSL